MSRKPKDTAEAAPAAQSPVVTTAAHADYTLTEARSAALTLEAAALGDTLLTFPGRLDQRIRHTGSIRIAAERDAADLVRTPFEPAPPITLEEIHAQRDRIEFLRAAESRFQALRSSQEKAVTEFETCGAEAAEIKKRLLRTFDTRFLSDAKGQRRISDIRDGSGDPDLVQDVSDVLVLCDEYAPYLAKCPRGEPADVARLRVLSPILSHLLAAKGMNPEAVAARKVRDGAFTLVMQSANRFRAGAAYWYQGTDKMKDYAPFAVPSRGRGAAATPDAAAAPDATPGAPTPDAPTTDAAPKKPIPA